MIRSMTGFSKAEHNYAGGKVLVELKTTNHRFYELSSRMPNHILFLEDKIRKYINAQIKRGRVNLYLAIEDSKAIDKLLAVNKNLAKRYYRILDDLKNQLRIKEPISLSHLISLPDIITSGAAESKMGDIWPKIKSALDKALAKLTRSREREGGILQKDLLHRISMIEALTEMVERQAPLVTADYKRRFQERIKQIAPSVELDASRLQTEVAIFAKNCDITEEIIRTQAHIKGFKDVIFEARQAGRQLDFIAQEMFREINTMGAKASDVKISKWVIQLKEQIEKIREQVQNVE